MLNIVVPMAGAGSRFASAGFVNPKPLIDVAGVPMIKIVIDNLTPKSLDHRFIFIVQAAHDETFGIAKLLEEWAPGCVVVRIDGLTDGAARTVLCAKEHFDDGNPLMIANSDQYIDADIDDYLSGHEMDDGFIMTMTADDPKWSFVRLDDEGLVTEVVEKVVVSTDATVGIYNFARGADFVWAAEAMIDAGRMANGEYYVAPAYNELIDRGARVTQYNIGSEAAGMYGLGVPDDLALFLSLPVLSRAIGATA
jgi:NDP-sugar pyrophosphorylase family protein